jgi:uncharacterized membrane protein
MSARVYIIVSVGFVALGFASGLALYSQVPDPAPIHWNVHGQADGYGPRWIDAFLLPAATALVLVLLVILPRVSRWRDNFQRFSRTYGRIMVAVIAGLTAVHLVVLLKATGHRVAIDRALPLVVGIMIAVVGNWMGKLRRNSLVGIRTPWTLASDLVWERTHRAGAKLMVAYGLVIALSALLAPGWATLIVVVGGALGLVVWAMFYSWAVHRRVRNQGASVG